MSEKDYAEKLEWQKKSERLDAPLLSRK